MNPIMHRHLAPYGAALIEWFQDHGWSLFCASIAMICLGAAWALKVFLMNPEHALSGWSPLYMLWGIIWIILIAIGFYGVLGLLCGHFIDSLDDR